MLSLYSVGIRTDLITFDILSNALYLYFNFTFEFKLSYGCDLYIVLGISHSIHLEGVGIDVLPFAATGAGLYFKVIFQFYACRSLAHHQSILGNRSEGCKSQGEYHECSIQ